MATISQLRANRDPRLTVFSHALHGVGFVGVLVIAGLFFTLVWWPLRVQQIEHVARSKNLERLLQEARPTRRVYAQLNEELDKWQQRAEAARSRVPEKAEEAEFLRFVTDVAEDENLEIRDYRRQGIEQHETHNELHIAIQCRGSHQALCHLLYQLHKAARLITVEKLAVNGSSQAGQHEIEMTIVLYYGSHPSTSKLQA